MKMLRWGMEYNNNNNNNNTNFRKPKSIVSRVLLEFYFRVPKYRRALRLTAPQIISEYRIQNGHSTTHKMIAFSSTILQTRANSAPHPSDSVQMHLR